MTSLPIEPSPFSEGTAAQEREQTEPYMTDENVQEGTLNTGNDTTGVPDTSRDFPESNTNDGVLLGEPRGGDGAEGTVDSVPSTHIGQSQDAKLAKVPGMDTHVNEGDSGPGFKEKVQGFHKVFHGHITGNAETKDEGKKILRGETQL